jgi:hypothetical protein
VRAAGIDAPSKPLLSNAQLIAAILVHSDRGMSMNRTWKEAPRLYSLAKKRFGSWHRALARAGLPWKCRRKWSPAKVIEAIQRRHREGLKMRNVISLDRSLAEAAIHYFGSWREAVLASGIPVRCRRQWTAELVIEVLQAWQREHGTTAGITRQEKSLSHVAKRYFGGMEEAMVAAGLPPTRRRWSRQRVLDTIQARLSRGEPMAAIWRVPGLRSAAVVYWGGRRKALLALGIPSPQPRQWTQAKITEAIRRRHEQGLSLGKSAGYEDSGLVSAAYYHFGSWTKALIAAGVQTSGLKWTPQTVIRELRAWYRFPKGKRPPRDWNLYAAAIRRFGSIRNALVAARLDPDQGRWTRQRVIDGIQDRYVRGLPMKPVQCENRALVFAAERFFGSWHKGMLAAGVLEK